jgi:predicted ABC-type ATPase
VALAKLRNFEIRLIYVLLDSVERNIARVATRVEKGGHDVPEQKIRERHVKSLLQLPWFLDQADQAFVFDNSGERIKKVADKVGGKIMVTPHYPQALSDVIRQIKASAVG